MAAGDYVVKGTFTLSASAPGTIATTTVTATGCAANDIVVITPTETAYDAFGTFQYKVTGVTTNAFVVSSDRGQLPNDVDFTFIVFDAA